ncbi:TadE/TadG family type IV pilus assembly protein [Desulfobulbus elongatus]|uniref:TadE/TadG family type IV pilus assembly protein n=1 Tax=Desulfobulbus elongatus TaxID=53332 RepID=UPI0005501585|nr:TadE/TadG family type IV pilus assembly protein [Desulfobulbus elongatus]
MKKFRHILRDQQGVAAMEFALVVPALLLIVFATIEYGWYLTQWMVLNNAASAGARAGVKAREWESSYNNEEDPVAFARSALKSSLWTMKEFPSDHVDIEILAADETTPRRLKVQVSDVPYQPITGYLGASLLPETLAAKAVLAFP